MNIIRSGLQGRVIDALEKQGPTGFEGIARALDADRGPERSEAGVHKALRALLDSGIIRKDGKQYAIDGNFVAELELYALRLRAATEPKSLPQENINRFRFSSLAETDRFINQLIFGWFKTSTVSHPYVQHAPHAWFSLAHPEEEGEIVETIVSSVSHFYTLANNRKFLDRWLARFYLSKRRSSYAMRERPSKREDDHYFGVFGDSYFECRYPQKVAARLAGLFERVTDLSELRPSELVDIFANKSNTIELHVGSDPAKATRLRQMVLRHFPG